MTRLTYHCKRLLAWTLSAAIALPAPAFAAATDISEGPLAQPATSVKPNMLLILDDSGSMARQFTPDYIASNANAGTVANCMDSRDVDNSVTTTPLDCFAGDPPMMSPDFNTQYYNPDIRYFPAVNFDGSSKGEMDAAATTNWTIVPTDNVSGSASDIARKNLHETSLTSTTAQSTNWDTGGNNTLQQMDLTTEFPDRVWCKNPGDDVNDTALCKVNSAYTYPNPTPDSDGLFWAYGRDGVGGTAGGSRKYRFGGPYYYRITPTEFCDNVGLVWNGTDSPAKCVAATAPITIGAVTYSFPAPVRFCNSVALTNCQGKRTSTFRFPKFLGTINPGAGAISPLRSRASITLTSDTGAPTVNQITVTRPSPIAPATVNLLVAGQFPQTTVALSSGANRTTAATQLKNAINAGTGTHGYLACVPTVDATFPTTGIACTGTPSSSTSAINVIAPPTANAGTATEVNLPNDLSTIAVTAPDTAPTTPAFFTFTMSNANNTTDRVNSLRFGPSGGPQVDLTAGSVSCGGSCTNTQMANNLRAAITAHAATPQTNAPSGHGYTVSGAGTSITITAPSTTGSERNGFPIAYSHTGLSNVSGSLGGGVTPGNLSHTLANFTGGVNGSLLVLPFRQNVGTFVRTNIVSGTTYPKAVARTDCAAPSSCTFDEEMTNFANWFAYYRTRIQMAKTSIGRAFLVLGNSFRVGFMTINFSTTHYLAVNDFTTTAGGQKDQWFTKLYGAMTGSGGSTPLRGALARAGQYYGNVRGGGAGSLSSDMGASPTTLACQPNYSILTSDGYWNDSSGFNNLAGTAVGNQDSGTGNPPAEVTPFMTKASGSWDGNAASNTLADVAMYYYKTDLRTDLSDQVPPSGIDTAPHQHMTTFTVGMGLAGTLQFDPNYLQQTSGDFFNIKQGSTLWPAPTSSSETTLDDLWHAAVNGRGRFFSAQDPVALSTGISDTLNAVQARIGAGAAAATSNLQPVAGDNFAFTAQYQTLEWSGDLKARTIDLSTGTVATRELWSAQAHLDVRPHTTRRIFTFDSGDNDTTTVLGVGPVKAITAIAQVAGVATVTSAAHGYATGAQVVVAGAAPAAYNGAFTITVLDANTYTYTVPAATATPAAGVISSVPGRTQNGNRLRSFCPKDADLAVNPQCDDGGLLTTAEMNDSFDPDGGSGGPLDQANTWAGDGSNRAASADPANMVHYLRGDRTNEMTTITATTATDLYRLRAHMLGDIVNAQPAYVRVPPFAYADPFYDTYKAANAARKGRVYVAANDGMLHAFDTDPDNNPFFQTAGIGTIVTSDDTFTGTLSTDPVSGEGSENWAYVPKLVFPKMKRLAEIFYSTNHAYLVDGTPVIADVCFGHSTAAPCSAVGNWKTILVAGLNNGGRGYYALDVTDPANPKGLWEINGGGDAACIAADTDVTATSGQTGDCNIGFTFGNPIIAKLPSTYVDSVHAGKWVVIFSSGHNNISPGDGQGHFYVVDAQTGQIILRKSTPVGSSTTPSGLARINAFVDESGTDNTALTVYGGDLSGNVWRFQLAEVTAASAGDDNIPSGSLALLATVRDPSNVAQSITVRPELGKVDNNRVVYFGTGRFYGETDRSNFQRQTVYAIKDTMTVLPGSTATAILDMTRSGSGSTSTITGFVRQTLAVDPGNSALRTIVADAGTGQPYEVDFNSDNGFFIDLPDGGSGTSDPSERVNVDPILQLGTLVMPSNVPNNDPATAGCVAGGYGYVNFFDYRSGGYVPGATSNMASSKVSASLIVGINVVQLPGGTVKTIVTTADNQQLTQDTPVAPATVAGRRVSWRELFIE